MWSKSSKRFCKVPTKAKSVFVAVKAGVATGVAFVVLGVTAVATVVVETVVGVGVGATDLLKIWEVVGGGV